MDGLRLAQDKMRAADVAAEAIEVFAHYFRQLAQGRTGHLPEADIEPLRDLPHADELDLDPQVTQDAFARTVVIKLNGGLGTSMGMDRAKSLLPVREGRSFLDVIVAQVLAARREYGVPLPLVFMNSFRTRDDTLAVVAGYENLRVADLPSDFMQSQEPKLSADDLTPVEWPADPSMEWCPPGHGDLYPSLMSSGILRQLLDAGYRYAFVSNSDNLGAVPEPRIAGLLATRQLPFVSEACRRTSADRKGGHLATRRSDGRLVLRESAQTLPEDSAAFSDTERHQFFNTNNLWLDLERLAMVMTESSGVLGLPLIRNIKTVDPADASTPRVIQIETAMGAAVEVFDGAAAVEVSRERFLPVKTTGDLLALRSDAYETSADHRVRLSARRTGAGRTTAPLVDLEPEHFRVLADFESRFPYGPPSLAECDRLTVRGDVTFGRSVAVQGSAAVSADVEDGAVIGS